MEGLEPSTNSLKVRGLFAGTASGYLIDQFLDYLEELSITIRQVRSGISEGIRDFTDQHGSTIASLGRLRSPQRLAAYP